MSGSSKAHEVHQPAAHRHVAFFILVLVVGALLGSFLGDFLAYIFPPDAQVRALFMKAITAGLTPTRLDLKVAECTFGFMVKLNITSVIGILVSAAMFKTALK